MGLSAKSIFGIGPARPTASTPAAPKLSTPGAWLGSSPGFLSSVFTRAKAAATALGATSPATGAALPLLSPAAQSSMYAAANTARDRARVAAKSGASY
jgi:hypothetical protein